MVHGKTKKPMNHEPFYQLTNNQPGYTLVELIVVIAVMVILGTVVISNFGTLGKDQALQKGVSDIQSFIRVAQTNATSRVPCPPTSTLDTDAGASWRVKFDSTTSISLRCQLSTGSEITPTGSQYTYTLGDNVIVYRINLNNPGCTPSSGYTITFAPLYGTLTFADPGAGCPASPNFLIILQNTSTGTTKSLIMDKGGSVYEQ